jgi:hypothetical protein
MPLAAYDASFLACHEPKKGSAIYAVAALYSPVLHRISIIKLNTYEDSSQHLRGFVSTSGFCKRLYSLGFEHGNIRYRIIKEVGGKLYTGEFSVSPGYANLSRQDSALQARLQRQPECAPLINKRSFAFWRTACARLKSCFLLWLEQL